MTASATATATARPSLLRPVTVAVAGSIAAAASISATGFVWARCFEALDVFAVVARSLPAV